MFASLAKIIFSALFDAMNRVLLKWDQAKSNPIFEIIDWVCLWQLFFLLDNCLIHVYKTDKYIQEWEFLF